MRSFRDYVLGLTYQIKDRALLGLVTTTRNKFLSEEATNELHISTISDTILLLHYFARGGEIGRAVNILKMRGSDHEKALREFYIDDSGLHIGGTFRGVRSRRVSVEAERAER